MIMAVPDSNAPVRRRPSRLTLTLQRNLIAMYTFVYRLTGGAIGGRIGQTPVLLLTTIGRKTGKPRTTPLGYLVDGENLLIVASNGGAATYPAWWLNLQAYPEARIQVQRQTLRVRAEQAAPEEQQHLWARFTAHYPSYAPLPAQARRTIPVIILRPLDRMALTK